MVLAWDETTRTTGLFTVTDLLVHIDPAQVHLSVGGEFIETTPEHPFYTLERGWVDAGDLWLGAHIRRANGSFAPVLFIDVETEAQVMYNLTVAEAHTFFVGTQRVLVHNPCEEAMPHDNRLFDDTSPQIAALLIQHWRDTPPLQKLAQMSSLNATAERLALAGLMRQYPSENEEQLRRRLHERHYGKAMVEQIYARRKQADAGT